MNAPGTPFPHLSLPGGKARFAPLPHLALIAVEGEDAKSFLHRQFTNDIETLGPNAARYAAWCTPKGRMLASFLVFRRGETYCLLLSSDLCAETLKRLGMFVLRSKVRLSALGLHPFGVYAPDCKRLGKALAAAGLAAPRGMMQSLSLPATPSTAAEAQATVIRLDETRALVVAETGTAAACQRRLSSRATQADASFWQWLDIEHGIVRIDAASREAFVPQMVDFDTIGGVSFKKGCYPGQEVIKRVQTRGEVKRHLYRIHAALPLEAGGALFTPATEDSEAAGVIVNAAPVPEDEGKFAALAVIRDGEAGAREARLGTPDGPALSCTRVFPAVMP